MCAHEPADVRVLEMAAVDAIREAAQFSDEVLEHLAGHPSTIGAAAKVGTQVMEEALDHASKYFNETGMVATNMPLSPLRAATIGALTVHKIASGRAV